MARRKAGQSGAKLGRAVRKLGKAARKLGRASAEAGQSGAKLGRASAEAGQSGAEAGKSKRGSWAEQALKLGRAAVGDIQKERRTSLLLRVSGSAEPVKRRVVEIKILLV